MDQQLLRVPLERASALFRLRQKKVERALAKALEATASPASAAASSTPNDARAQAAELLREARADALRLGAEEERCLLQIERRLEYLATPDRMPFVAEVAITEWLLREGLTRSARELMDSVLTPQQRELVDDVVLLEIRGAMDALSQRDLAPALAWSRDNASRLRRLDSTLEFALRRQEFVELVRQRNLGGALEQASAFLAPAAKAAATAAAERERDAAGPAASPPSHSGSGGGVDCMQQLQEVMSVLAFADPPRCGVPELQKLFSPGAWGELVSHFRRDSLAAMGFLPRSPLEYYLAVGLTALKTPSCRADGGRQADGTLLLPFPAASGAAGGSSASASSGSRRRTVMIPSVAELSCSCPLCHPAYFAAALPKLPHCRRTVSALLDPVTNEPLNEDNPPLVVPNGRVYGTRTLELLTSEDKTKVLCPATGEVFAKADVRRAYFV